MGRNFGNALTPHETVASPLGEPPGPARSGAGSAADELIRLSLLNELHWDLAVPRNRLNVEVRRGWVTLSGSVDRVYSKDCAERHARATPGALGVTNAITVED